MTKNNLLCRVDSFLPDIPEKTGYVSAVFNHSFDILVDDFLLNCTSQENTLHPLSLLGEKRMVEKTKKEQKVKFSYPYIKINGQKFKLCPDIKPARSSKPINKDLLPYNIRQLKKSLKISGQPTLLDKTGGSGLAGAAKLVQAKLNYLPLNAVDFIEFFGRGAGLTPTWDDFFAGMLLTDRISGKNIIINDRKFFSKIKRQTTTTSYWQLKFAEKGKFALQFEKLVHKMLAEKTKAADFITPLTSGHSSGTDICRGILLYLETELNKS
jgi:hypothetical protein